MSTGASGKPIHVRVGAGLEPIVDDPAITVVNISGVSGNVRNIAGMELTAERFGRKRFKSGDTIEFSSTFVTHGRAYRTEWQGRFTLRGKFANR